MTRSGGNRIAIALALALTLSCGGPSSPSPVPNPPPPPPAANLAPVIRSVQASVERVEVGADVALTAVVEDAETPLAQLKLEWKADAGTITGEGASVVWRAPVAGVTPKDYAITLTVTETYGTAPAGGTRPQHLVSAQSPIVRVHDSPKELGDMSVTFLTDFANSEVSAARCVRDFSDTCVQGKGDEFDQISDNRDQLRILGSSLRLRSVRVASNNVRADMTVACSFTSRIVKCPPNATGCVVGAVGTVAGDCVLTGVYEQKRWWLCTSNFNGVSVPNAFRAFFGRER